MFCYLLYNILHSTDNHLTGRVPAFLPLYPRNIAKEEWVPSKVSYKVHMCTLLPPFAQGSFSSECPQQFILVQIVTEPMGGFTHVDRWSHKCKEERPAQWGWKLQGTLTPGFRKITAVDMWVMSFNSGSKLAGFLSLIQLLVRGTLCKEQCYSIAITFPSWIFFNDF